MIRVASSGFISSSSRCAVSGYEVRTMMVTTHLCDRHHADHRAVRPSSVNELTSAEEPADPADQCERGDDACGAAAVAGREQLGSIHSHRGKRHASRDPGQERKQPQQRAAEGEREDNHQRRERQDDSDQRFSAARICKTTANEEAEGCRSADNQREDADRRGVPASHVAQVTVLEETRWRNEDVSNECHGAQQCQAPAIETWRMGMGVAFGRREPACLGKPPGEVEGDDAPDHRDDIDVAPATRTEVGERQRRDRDAGAETARHRQHADRECLGCSSAFPPQRSRR